MRLLILLLISILPLSAQVIGGDSGSSGSGGGGGLAGCNSAATKTIATGSITLSTDGCYKVDTESAAASDDLTAITCPANTSFTLIAANDARTAVLKSSSFAVYGAVDQSLDQDGDYALGYCPATDTPIIYAFYDEAGIVSASGGSFSGTGPAVVITEEAAPGAATTAGDHNLYFDSTSGRLVTHKNGGSALIVNYNITHATDCTAVTVVGTGVALVAGDRCHELDADTQYVYDGAAWDLVGGSTGVTTVLASGYDAGSTSTSATNLVTYNFTAGTIQAGDIIEVEALFTKVGTVGTMRTGIMWINNSNEIGSCGVTTGATTYTGQTAQGRFFVTGTTSQDYAARQYSGPTAENVCFGNYAGDITGTIAMSFRVISVNASDTVTLEYYIIKRIRP